MIGVLMNCAMSLTLARGDSPSPCWYYALDRSARDPAEAMLPDALKQNHRPTRSGIALRRAGGAYTGRTAAGSPRGGGAESGLSLGAGSSPCLPESML